MSEEINNEVEAVETEQGQEPTPHEVQQAAIRQMMDQWADGKLTDAQSTFNDVMGGRADALVSDKKAEIAATIYNDPITDSSEEEENSEPEEVEVETEADVEQEPEVEVEDTPEEEEVEQEETEGEPEDENI
jgi:hypothetical protein